MDRIVPPSTAAADPDIAAAMRDAQTVLSQMAGKDVPIGPDAGGVALRLTLTGAPGDSRDTYTLRSGAEGVEVVAATPQGLSHGVYGYLNHVGVRWLSASPGWTVVPRGPVPVLSLNETVTPRFKYRAFGATGGFYATRWSNRFDGSLKTMAKIKDWQRRLRLGGDYILQGHVGEAFVADPAVTPKLAADPNILAVVNGRPSPLHLSTTGGPQRLNLSAKLNAANPAAVELFCDWVLARFQKARAGRDQRLWSYASVEPSDGGGYGDAALGPGDGSPSDQIFHIANRCAKRIGDAVPGAGVNVYAYAGHSRPPSFRLEHNVMVQLVPYGFQSAPPDLFIQAWRTKASRFALYDYWTIPDWSYDEHAFDYREAAAKIRLWASHGVEGFNAETTNGMGPIALAHYIAAHAMWNPDIDAAALEQEWFALAFGDSAPEMRQLYERLAGDFRLNALDVAAWFAILDRAIGRNDDPAVAARLADVAAYLEYLRLRLGFVAAQTAGARAEAGRKVIAHLIAVHDAQMVQTTRIFDLMARGNPILEADFAIAPDGTRGPAWSGIRALGTDEKLDLVQRARAALPAMALTLRVGPSRASATRAVQPMATGSLSGVLHATGPLHATLTVAEGRHSVRFDLAGPNANTVTFHDTSGRLVAAPSLPGGAEGAWRTIETSLTAGQYAVRFHPEGGIARGHFSLRHPAELRLTLQKFRIPAAKPAPRLYVTSPDQDDVFAIFAPGRANARFTVLDSTGAPVPVTFMDENRVILARVSSGEQATIWAVDGVVAPSGEPHALNAPQAWALSPQALSPP